MVYHEVATPLTNMRYSLNPGGSFTGSAMTVDNTFDARLRSITPIPNVLLSSAWTSSFGVGHVLLGSKQVARHALDYLNS
jgi:prolycopene isomerase